MLRSVLGAKYRAWNFAFMILLLHNLLTQSRVSIHRVLLELESRLLELVLLLSLWVLSFLSTDVQEMNRSTSLTRIQVHCILQKIVHVTLDLYILVLPFGLQLLASL